MLTTELLETRCAGEVAPRGTARHQGGRRCAVGCAAGRWQQLRIQRAVLGFAALHWSRWGCLLGRGGAVWTEDLTRLLICVVRGQKVSC